MSSKLVVLLWKHSNFLNFKYGLDFWNREILLAIGAESVETHQHAKLCKIDQSVAKIFRFFDSLRWRPSPCWIFEIVNFYFLTVSGGPRRIIVPNFVKIGRSVAEILRFFEFSRWRPSAILDYFEAHLDHLRWVLIGLYHCAKFGYDWCSSFYNMNILIFDTFGRKIPIHAPKIGVLGQFIPKMGCNINESHKRHILASVRVIWAIKRENVVSGLTCMCVA